MKAGRRLARSAPVSGIPPTPSFDGKWREGPLREDYTVQQWSPTGCGPAPVSSATGGGDLVSVHQEGDELSISGGGRVFRTNQCYDQLPTLARETHSRDPSGHSWRTRCSTPPSDPRHATMNTLVVATDSHIDVTETGRYEIVLSDGRLAPDPEARRPGRGAYVCRNSDCVAEAVRRKGFERSFRAQVRVPNDHLDWVG